MAIFDNAAFDPQTYNGGMSGWLMQALQSGLLGRSLGQSEQTPMQSQIGPTFANGNNGMMGGVPFPIAPGPEQNSMLPPNAQPTGPAQIPQAPMSQPPMGGQEPGMMDRLSAFTHNLGAGGGLIPGLMDAIQGAQTGQRLDPQGMQQQQMQATYKAVLAHTGDPGLAAASAYNPKILETVMEKPKWGIVNEDMMGGKQYGYPPNPYAAGQQRGPVAAGANNSAQTFDTIAKARDAGASQDELINMAPVELRSYVKALIKGDAVPTNLPMRGNARTNALTLAHAIDPSFDEQLIPMRKTFATSMGSQNLNSFGGQVRSSGTIVKHLGRAHEALNAIVESGGALGPNETLSILNRPQLYLKGQSGDKKFNDAMGRYDTATEGAAGEINQLLTGGVGAESAKQEWRDKLNIRTQPLSKVKASLDELAHLMMGRLDNVAQAKERAFGRPTDPISLLGPGEQEIARKIASGTFKGQQDTPTQGASPISKSQYDALPKGATYTAPDGSQRTKQ